MIRSFRCKDTEKLFVGRCPPRFRAFRAVAERKLTQLHNAATLEFLRSPPGNRLEALSGDRFSIGYPNASKANLHRFPTAMRS